MPQNVVEYLRQSSVEDLFELNSFRNVWQTWKPLVNGLISARNSHNVLNLGDHLAEVFRSTGTAGRGQNDVSIGGTVWEALVCWYMNLCLVNSRTVVIKHKKYLLPTPVVEAITVNYGTFPSNTESDLIAITFPDRPDYTTTDKFNITIRDNQGQQVETRRRGEFNYKPVIDAMVDRDFNDCEIGIIQCKTNWNDNAQIPMLWDMVYASRGFNRHQITVGTSAYNINHLRRFTYSFVTVPTTTRTNFTPTSTCVRRVYNITGGNYWGQPTLTSVASSIKEIFGRNFTSGESVGLVRRLNSALPNLATNYAYFNLD